MPRSLNSSVMPKAFFISILLGLSAVVSTQAQTPATGGTTSVDGLAAYFVMSESNEAVQTTVDFGRNAGLSDIQIATAFGLALETCLQEGPREHLPILMTGFEEFVVASSEPVGPISNAFEAGQQLARSRAEAGRPMISTEEDPVESAPRATQAPLRSSPVGGGSSARGATGGGGGGVVSGGASPS
jgi:hypothetical protein